MRCLVEFDERIAYDSGYLKGVSMSAQVNVEFLDGIQIITINRPEARNAISVETAHQLSAAFDELDARDDIRIGILTGAGGTFSSGMDLKDFAQTRKRALVEGKGFGGLNEAPPKKPLIAAVEGYAVAGGFEMVLACDLVVAANNAMFGLPEVKRGLVAGSGGLLRLPRQLPYHIAMEIILTGDLLPAARAHQYGLINVMTDPGQALAEAIKLAQRICENGPLAVQTSKSVVNQGADFSADDMFDLQRPLIHHIFMSDDAKEGATAFAQKRKPVWTGK
jgi:enoyl-CoA hydratase